MNIRQIAFEKSTAFMAAYLLDASPELGNIKNRPAVLVFPGGAYRITSDREAEPIAMAYLAAGYQAFVLRYRVGEHSSFEAAFDDAQHALSMIRTHSQEWNTDPEKVAVIGFSAGGHLAAALAAMGSSRPNALLLGYPCIYANPVLAFPVPSLEKEVDAATPPTFLFATFEDELVPIQNSLSFMQALNDRQIPFESHIFQKGAHGLSLGKPLSSSGIQAFVDRDFAQWFDLSLSWLHKQFGDFVADRTGLIPEAKESSVYSVDVQIGSLLENTACKQLLLAYIPELDRPEVIEGVRALSIRMIHSHLPRPLAEAQLDELNAGLRNIPYTDQPT